MILRHLWVEHEHGNTAPLLTTLAGTWGSFLRTLDNQPTPPADVFADALAPVLAPDSVDSAHALIHRVIEP